MNYSTKGAARDNKGKAKLHLVPKEAMEAIAEVLWKSSIPGGGKYPMGNWKKGAEHSVPLDSLLRHAMKRAEGIMNDEESGMPHSYHMLINAVFMVYYEKHHPELNNLVPVTSPPASEGAQQEKAAVPPASAQPSPASFNLTSAMPLIAGLMTAMASQEKK